MKMKWTLILSIGLIVLLGMFGMTYFSIDEQKTALIQEIVKKTTSSGESYANMLQNMEDMMNGRMVSAAYYVRELDQQKSLTQADLTDAAKKTGMTVVDLLDGQANWQLSTDPANLQKKLNLFAFNPNYAKQYEPLFAGQNPVDISPLIIRSQDGKIFKFVKVFRGPGKGIVQVGMEASVLEKIQKQMVQGDASVRNITLLNPTGLVLTSVDSADKKTGLYEQGKTVKDDAWINQNLKDGKVSSRFLPLSNERGLQIFVPVKSEDKTPYFTVFTVSLEGVYADLNHFQWKMIYLALGISLFIMMIMTIFTFRFTKQITQPVETMSQMLENMAERGGDLTEEIKIKSYAEINRLGEAQNKVFKSIRKLVMDVTDSSHDLFTASEQLSMGAQQSAEAADLVIRSISEVTFGADKQKLSCEKAVSTAEQVAATIQKIAGNATEVVQLTDQTADALQSGNSAVTTAIDQMNNLEKFVANSAEQVGKLGTRSQEIGQLVDTISAIAGQTNLLALNAAIESARAGEQGRGFAVVAEEVRKLAEQSDEAAKKIANVIYMMQADTSNAIDVMNQGAHEVVAGNTFVRTAGEAFEKISMQINHVRGEIRGMSSSIQEIAENSHEFVAVVQEIDRVSSETVAQTQTVSAATEEQTAAMEEIAASSQSLTQMAEHMKAAVGKFKL